MYLSFDRVESCTNTLRTSSHRHHIRCDGRGSSCSGAACTVVYLCPTTAKLGSTRLVTSIMHVRRASCIFFRRLASNHALSWFSASETWSLAGLTYLPARALLVKTSAIRYMTGLSASLEHLLSISQVIVQARSRWSFDRRYTLVGWRAVLLSCLTQSRSSPRSACC